MSTPKLAETARTHDAAGKGTYAFRRKCGRAPWIEGLQMAFGNDGRPVQILVVDRSLAKSGQKESCANELSSQEA